VIRGLTDRLERRNIVAGTMFDPTDERGTKPMIREDSGEERGPPGF